MPRKHIAKRESFVMQVSIGAFPVIVSGELRVLLLFLYRKGDTVTNGDFPYKTVTL